MLKFIRGDVDTDGVMDFSGVFPLLDSLFPAGGDPPPAPDPECGVAAGALDCAAAYTPCE
jgi:hypothetical protein